jgi:hypothetical protein
LNPRLSDARKPTLANGRKGSNSVIEPTRASNQYPLHLIQTHLIIAPIIEPRRPRRLMIGHLLRDLELVPIAQVLSDPRRPARVIADLRANHGSPTSRLIDRYALVKTPKAHNTAAAARFAVLTLMRLRAPPVRRSASPRFCSARDPVSREPACVMRRAPAGPAADRLDTQVSP